MVLGITPLWGLLAVGMITAPDTLTTKVWFTNDFRVGDFEYPEAQLDVLSRKTNSAIIFTGGGVRSYTCTLGSLAGLRDAGLLEKPRYIGGVSGGSWAVATYNYAQLGRPGVAASDQELLCKVGAPENTTLDSLKVMPSTCARKSGLVSLPETLLKLFLDGVSEHELWTRLISTLYLEPQGISSESFFSFDQDTVAAIVAANPSLNASEFVLPSPNRPFMVIGTTMVGPQGFLLSSSNHSWTSFEGTPLYYGQPHIQNVSYLLADLDPFKKQAAINLTSGGFIEPWAVGTTLVGHPTPVVPGGTVQTAPSATPFRLRELIGMSSFVAGGVTSSILPASVVANLSPQFANWARDARTPVKQMVYADGGLMENLPLIPMLRRRVPKIVAFVNAEGSLAPANVWDPTKEPYELKHMDDYVPGYFGVMPSGQFGYDTSRDQVFPKADFPRVVSALQSSMAMGKGAIATTNLTTIENVWWGVRGGISVTVTWVYLSRASAWEARLPESVRKHVIPESDPSNPQNLPKSGPFENFPHYDDITQTSLTASQANLLADMTGWIISANIDTFRAALT